MERLGNSPILVVVIAAVVAAGLAFAVNSIDSLLLAWVVMLMLPIVAGSFAGMAQIPGRFGLLTIVATLTAFFATAAAVTTGHDASLAAEIFSYIVVGIVMFVLGMISFFAMRAASSTSV